MPWFTREAVHPLAASVRNYVQGYLARDTRLGDEIPLSTGKQHLTRNWGDALPSVCVLISSLRFPYPASISKGEEKSLCLRFRCPRILVPAGRGRDVCAAFPPTYK